MITTTISSSIRVKPRAFTALPPGRERASIRKARNRRPYCGPCPPFLQEACLTLGIDPILSSTNSYDERHAQIGHPFHLAFYKGTGNRPLVLGNFEDQLVVHLQDHLGAQIRLFERRMDSDHRDFDEIGGRTLEWGVGCGPLPEGADTEVSVPQLGDVAAPPEQRLYEPALACFIDGFVQPGTHAGEALEVVLDERLRLFERDPELPRQRQRALAVNRREVEGLGAPAHLSGHVCLRAAEDHRGRLPVDVAAALKCRDERRIVREMRE